MKYLILPIALLLTACMPEQTKEDIVASKCRLKVPVIKEQCEAVDVKHTKGGQLQGLPVTRGK